MNRSQTFLLICIALSAIASLYVISPFLEYVLGAVILAYILYPLHQRLVPYLGVILSPIALIGASSVAVFLPVLYISTVFYQDVIELTQGETALDITEVEAAILDSTGYEVDLEIQLTTLGESVFDVLFGSVSNIVTVGLQMSLGFALVLFLVYYTLKDGDRFVEWIHDVTPLPDPVTDRLFAKIDQMVRGVVIGHIAVAIIQGIVAGIGMWVVGIPNVVFWTFVMIILALLPLIGAFLIWGPAAVYLFLIGDAVGATALAIYGVAIVSMIDNYARPILIDQQVRLNPAIILVGVFGGVYTIGFTGLFVGPVILGVLAATLTTFNDEFDLL
ncbi:AI-2E family transporter [Natronocalculus amylovorans]|uniref:AI-2E family transporter n=1 Tax=Natronocalculus amylovorans TaxID=2917812 RepID=A0AAE3K9E1_9EURY|nr:AI-2E family transporter [Natronocalculus amylovorans]MCL9817976.1 AI-2E family transporter [Natronocalculus amylovorans]NUE03090.1 AI-2E family transporter [Halorubraceae archaeon YAN]